MNKRKVIIYSEDFPPYPGGIAQWAAGVANSLIKLGHEVRVITRYREKYSDKFQEWKFLVQYVQGDHWKQLRSWYWYKSLKQLLNNGVLPDLIIATTWNCSRGLLAITKKNNIKLVTVAHGLEVTRKMSAIKKKWLSRTLKKNDYVISVSHFTRNKILEMYPVDPRKIIVFPNGVDLSIFKPELETHSLKKKHNLTDEKIILTLARVVERKGHDKVIEAIPAVLKKIPNLKYIIAGSYENSYYNKLQHLIVDLKFTEVVIFTGYIHPNEIPDYYNLCDVYIMPSRELESSGDTEGFGITYLEANACGKPVIGGNSGGVSDAIVDGETGFLVNPTDVDEIANKLFLLLSDPELAQKLGKNGRDRIKKSYTWDIITRDILDKVFN